MSMEQQKKEPNMIKDFWLLECFNKLDHVSIHENGIEVISLVEISEKNI